MSNLIRNFILVFLITLFSFSFANAVTPDQIAGQNLKLWLDGNDSSTLFKDANCSQQAAVGG